MATYTRDVENEARRLLCRFGPENAEAFAINAAREAHEVESDLTCFWDGVVNKLEDLKNAGDASCTV